MKIYVFLSLIVLSALTAAQDMRGLRLFYCIHAEGTCMDPSAPVRLDATKALAIARKALAAKDDYVGFVDADETTLQFYVESPDSVLIDMPVPEKKGSFGVRTSRAEALKIVGRLSPPLSRYRSELKMEFAKWD
jgi:hypothetical protein